MPKDQPSEPIIDSRKPVKGRGAGVSPMNRFDQILIEKDPEYDPSEDPLPRTQFFRDASKSLITYSDSPDLGHIAGINVYRGCEHGCVYCYARPYHEYFGLSGGMDFESKIFVKEKAPELLRAELSKRGWKPQVLMMSGVTDCYQPAERKFRLTRRCLEVLLDFRNPVGIITKNRLVTRDIDILRQMAQYDCCSVTISLTTLRPEVARVMEPRTSQPQDRLRTVRELHEAGIPVGVNIAPIVPGLTDEEIPALVKAAAEAGAQRAGLIIVRLPYAVKDIFVQWLHDHFPEKKEKILNRIRGMRNGKLYDAKWGARRRGEGVYAEQIQKLFEISCKRSGLPKPAQRLSTKHFRDAQDKQFKLF